MDWGLAFDIGEWVIRIIMIPVVAREHRAQVALAWLGVILLVPFVGLPLYLLFGEYNLRHRVKAHEEIRGEVEARERLRQQAPSLLHPDFTRPVRDLARLTGSLTAHGAFPVVDGNAVQLIEGQREGIERVLEDIERAERHVHLLFFLFNGDDTGRRVGEALIRAVQRGVRCRLLVDPVGSGITAEPSFFRTLKGPLEEQGVEVRSTMPVRLLRRPLARLDIRNHRKIVVVDGRVAYTGSLNIHDPGFGLEDGEWRQLTVRLEGPAVEQLQLLFVEDWRAAGGELLSGLDYF
ncbi:MAG TPA: phospholipase D-like domain-containing protein, partial [Thermoanaerobaculia bacterium]|nr:phospholipase D-like domain-containing protein [Thermoanaerobaculia bacterium]